MKLSHTKAVRWSAVYRHKNERNCWSIILFEKVTFFGRAAAITFHLMAEFFSFEELPRCIGKLTYFYDYRLRLVQTVKFANNTPTTLSLPLASICASWQNTRTETRNTKCILSKNSTRQLSNLPEVRAGGWDAEVWRDRLECPSPPPSWKALGPAAVITLILPDYKLSSDIPLTELANFRLISSSGR